MVLRVLTIGCLMLVSLGCGISRVPHAPQYSLFSYKGDRFKAKSNGSKPIFWVLSADPCCSKCRINLINILRIKKRCETYVVLPHVAQMEYRAKEKLEYFTLYKGIKNVLFADSGFIHLLKEMNLTIPKSFNVKHTPFLVSYNPQSKWLRLHMYEELFTETELTNGFRRFLSDSLK